MDLELGLVRVLTTDKEFHAEFVADPVGALSNRRIRVSDETLAALVEAVRPIFPTRRQGGRWITYRDLTPSALGIS